MKSKKDMVKDEISRIIYNSYPEPITVKDDENLRISADLAAECIMNNFSLIPKIKMKVNKQ